jgi:hypothetical protein
MTQNPLFVYVCVYFIIIHKLLCHIKVSYIYEVYVRVGVGVGGFVCVCVFVSLCVSPSFEGSIQALLRLY